MDSPNTPLLLATGNPGKVREMIDLFAEVPIEFRSLADFPGVIEVAETGSTFLQNATLKAIGYARQTGLRALADDSGLEIAALNGAPGVYSARYGGETATFIERMAMVLDEMQRSGNATREARFVCSIVVADEIGRIAAHAEGECRGTIATAPRGDGGFGYDPIFIPDGFDETFGELAETVKQRISHRARAAEKIIRYLLDFTGTST